MPGCFFPPAWGDRFLTKISAIFAGSGADFKSLVLNAPSS